MKKQIRLLIVEDNEDDALLIIEEFKKSDYEVDYARVWTEVAMREALLQGAWDAITCDHNMPSFDSVQALKILKASGLDLPFILVSGSIGEMKAVEVMKAGAHDYIVKGSLTRLVMASEREIREAKNREIGRRVDSSQRFLAEVSAILVSSLEYHTTIQSILNAVAPKIADCCIIDLLDIERKKYETYAVHVDKKENLILEMRQHHPLVLDQYHSAMLIPLIAQSDFAPEYIDALIGLGFNSAMFVPLEIRNKLVGVITFLIKDKRTEYDEIDLTLAEELAQRSANAIDNTHLFQKSLEAIQLRDDFLAIASHELRTPITSLRLKLQVLLREFQKKGRESLSNEYIVESLKFSDRQISRFIKLIEELLNVSRITQGKFELHRENVNLIDIIEELANQFSEEIKASGSTLDVDLKVPIVGFWDYSRIEQIIENLLSNAIKYGAGGLIKISATIEGAMAKIIVEDHGGGIEKKDQSRVFERFERAVSTLNYGGLGLGLYITKQIIEAHEGSIILESELGKGSKFIIRIPLRSESYQHKVDLEVGENFSHL